MARPTRKELEKEIAGLEKSVIHMGELLRGVCDALRGKHPDPFARYSTHDMPKWAKLRMRQLRAAKTELAKFKDLKRRTIRIYPP